MNYAAMIECCDSITIGDDAVIVAGSVVTKDVPLASLVAGVLMIKINKRI